MDQGVGGKAPGSTAAASGPPVVQLTVNNTFAGPVFANEQQFQQAVVGSVQTALRQGGLPNIVTQSSMARRI